MTPPAAPQRSGLDQPMVLPITRRQFRHLCALAVLYVIYDQRSGIATLIDNLLSALA